MFQLKTPSELQLIQFNVVNLESINCSLLQGCRPFTAASSGSTPQCNERCVSGYSKSWTDDIRHGIAYFQVTSTVEQIQHEIVINGPVSAYMEVFEDFYSYGGGMSMVLIYG